MSSFALPENRATGPITFVVIDTGVCDDHPSLVGRIINQIDLTGEGATDENGHGTAVAAILATNIPTSRIISVKAMNARGQATVALLNHAIRVAANLLSGREGVGVINVSAGRRTPLCKQDCPLCTTARQLWETSNLAVTCAAGNAPGVTYCPAKSVFSVATPDEWSAPGDVTVFPPGWTLTT
ncbi:S8 family serine peptidase [Mycetocola zhadangensis]|uniref:S8 family serine peptidase n=1 Tax=Mycetocola zhadangensis TaxID=1164595 RepID=UPI003A4D72E0